MAFCLALFVVNSFYGFRGCLTKLGDYKFFSKTFTNERGENRFHGNFLGGIRVPLPRPYVVGIDLQKCDFEPPARPTFVAGNWYHDGAWWYYLYGLVVKTSHSFQLFLIIALGLAASGYLTRRTTLPRMRWLDLICVMGPAVYVLGVASAMSGLANYRYVLPAFGFLCVFAASITPRLGQLGLSGVTVFLLVFAMLSTAWAFPNHLAYFNELAGGVGGQGNKLLGCSMDWGQDLWFLERYAQNNPECHPIRFVRQYSLHPQRVGISANVIRNHTYNELTEWPSGTYAFERTTYSELIRDGVFERLRSEGVATTVVDSVGGSLLVVRVVAKGE